MSAPHAFRILIPMGGPACEPHIDEAMAERADVLIGTALMRLGQEIRTGEVTIDGLLNGVSLMAGPTVIGRAQIIDTAVQHG